MMLLRVLAALSVLLLGFNADAATTLLPPGEQCFQTANGPISSGSVNMYIPNTSTPTFMLSSRLGMASTSHSNSHKRGCGGAAVWGRHGERSRRQWGSGDVCGLRCVNVNKAVFVGMHVNTIVFTFAVYLVRMHVFKSPPRTGYSMNYDMISQSTFRQHFVT